MASEGVDEANVDNLLELELNPVRVLPEGPGVLAPDAVLVIRHGGKGTE